MSGDSFEGDSFELDAVIEYGTLGGEEFVDALFRVVEHCSELLAGVGVVLGGGLGFDEAAVRRA